MALIFNKPSFLIKKSSIRVTLKYCPDGRRYKSPAPSWYLHNSVSHRRLYLLGEKTLSYLLSFVNKLSRLLCFFIKHKENLNKICYFIILLFNVSPFCPNAPGVTRWGARGENGLRNFECPPLARFSYFSKVEGFQGSTLNHPEIIRADNFSVGFKSGPFIVKFGSFLSRGLF